MRGSWQAAHVLEAKRPSGASSSSKSLWSASEGAPPSRILSPSPLPLSARRRTSPPFCVRCGPNCAPRCVPPNIAALRAAASRSSARTPFLAPGPEASPPSRPWPWSAISPTPSPSSPTTSPPSPTSWPWAPISPTPSLTSTPCPTTTSPRPHPGPCTGMRCGRRNSRTATTRTR